MNNLPKVGNLEPIFLQLLQLGAPRIQQWIGMIEVNEVDFLLFGGW